MPFTLRNIIILAACITICLSSAAQERATAFPVGQRAYTSHSVLGSGSWYKIGVIETGVYKIGYNDLQDLGINPSSVNPATIGIFGRPGTMLPEMNSVPRADDAPEIPVLVTGASDGRFDPADQIIFYAEGPVTWQYAEATQMWEHSRHIYTDTIYLLLTTDRGNRRIQTQQAIDKPVLKTSTSYVYTETYDDDKVNLIASGRQWFGQVFDLITTRQIAFNIPKLAPEGNVLLKSLTAAKSVSASSFVFSSGINSFTAYHTPTGTYTNSPEATLSRVHTAFRNVQLPLKLNVQFNKTAQGAMGYIDYIDVNAACALEYNNQQMIIRNAKTATGDTITRFQLSNAAGKATIWDVSNFDSIQLIETETVGTALTWKARTASKPIFAVFGTTDLRKPFLFTKINNQDLHSIQSAGMIIIAPSVFGTQAARLAAFHKSNSGLEALVIRPDEIYNEFSAATPDITAIRDFMKMLCDRAIAGKPAPYLLLFGDASYDYRNITASNTNFVPTWQSAESLDPVLTNMSDDYFGLVDANEGSMLSDVIDIGIGRLPVKTSAEAENAVNKIVHYATQAPSVHGDWRNRVVFVADDEDENEHIDNSEIIASKLEQGQPDFNPEKIYLDAYPQVVTPSGNRYPEVNKAITQHMEKGCLIMNYIGHGGETGWAHEKVLTIPEINNWSNTEALPVFITATCEFSRFDNPALTSAGELAFLNPQGGAIALFTTTRPTYGTQNFELNKKFYQYALSKSKTNDLRLGDIILKSKRDAGSNDNGRKYVLLGDPALRLAVPEYKVVTSSINGRAAGSGDTLKALMPVTIEGLVTDNSENVLSDFNGTVVPTIFDKATVNRTLSNDGEGAYDFSLRKNILYRGKIAVKDGRFSFTFIVPKDISYDFAEGKISYYASDSLRDAAGNDTQIIVGGVDAASVSDNRGPEIRLFMNDLRFRDGGLTDQNPKLIALFSDESGINTIGTGIGHDITAVLDGESDEPFILNDFYVSDFNTYSSGSIRFPFTFLPVGEHTLEVKAWDIANNSSVAVINFRVQPSGTLVIDNPRCYPNPFKQYTDIMFEHNQQNTGFSIKAEIFTSTGMLVKTLTTLADEPGSVSIPLRWDGTSESGAQLRSGLYVYRLKISTSNGLYAETSGKIIYNK